MAGPILSEAEIARVEAAVRAAERGTSAELVVVVARGSGEGDASALLWPALAALALPLPLVLLAPRLAAPTVYAAQLALLLAGLLLLQVPGLAARLAPPAARRGRTRRAARDQFFERGLHLTAARTGVLLYVTAADRCAELIADAGASGPLSDEVWRPCLEGLAAEARRDRLADGLVAAVERLGAVLRRDLPAGPGDPNEVADRPVVL
jgi:putative membrane protein